LLVNWANLVLQVEMAKQENLDEMEHQANLEHQERWDQVDERDMLDLLEFQDIQALLVPLGSVETKDDQDFQEKTEHLDRLVHKDQ